jgi:transposase InsO family protein
MWEYHRVHKFDVTQVHDTVTMNQQVIHNCHTGGRYFKVAIYILVVIDSFTKAIELIPIVNMKAKTVALALVEKVYLVHGCPEVLVSDQGTHFVAAILKEINNILQVKHVTTPAYHQLANGSTERVIQSIKKLLAMTIKGQPNKWGELLPYVRFAYMNNIHASTGLTPFFMLYCRDPSFPMDLPTDPRYTRVFYDYDTGMKHRILTNAKIIHDYARQTGRTDKPPKKGV